MKSKTFEVYKITNLINNKIYIGITNQGAGVRFQKHLSDALHGSPFPIHNALRKYGRQNFSLEIIEFCKNSEELKEREKYWISFYNANDRSIGYNMTEGGDGTFGRTLSEETKEKIRQKAIGRKASEETKKKMSELRKGYKITDNVRNVFNKCNANRSKKVLQFDLDGNFLNEYASISEAAKASKTDRNVIARWLKMDDDYKFTIKSKRKTRLPKFIWILKKEELKEIA